MWSTRMSCVVLPLLTTQSMDGVTIVDGAFAAPYGAPTAGPPPYYVYEIRPETVFAFTTDESPPRPTRWRFL